MTVLDLPNRPTAALDGETRRTRARYDRIARVYDRMEAGAEVARFRAWRAMLWQRVHGPRVLELGGASGGYTSAKREIVELLRQRSRPYLFSNSVAPSIVGASIAAIEML